MPGLLIVVITVRWIGSGFLVSSYSAKVTPYKLCMVARENHTCSLGRSDCHHPNPEIVFPLLMSWVS